MTTRLPRLLTIAGTAGLLGACTTTRVVEYAPPPGSAPAAVTTPAPPPPAYEPPAPAPVYVPEQQVPPAPPPSPQGYVPMSQRVSQPKYGQTHVVEKGETVYHISTTNGITPLDLALWNDIPPPYTIKVGQRLRLFPRGGQPPMPPVASAPVPASPPPPPRPVVAVPVPVPAPVPVPVPVPVPAPVATRPAVPAPATPTAGNLAWAWPANGQLAGSYVAGDPARQGLDIAGVAGTPVWAAADGTVVYSGSGLVGYGELIIIKHNSEWLSAYGHNRTRLVKEGQRVVRGQQIAEMGRTAAPRDMLHFEIRYDGKPVDPLLYLPRR